MLRHGRTSRRSGQPSRNSGRFLLHYSQLLDSHESSRLKLLPYARLQCNRNRHNHMDDAWNPECKTKRNREGSAKEGLAMSEPVPFSQSLSQPQMSQPYDIVCKSCGEKLRVRVPLPQTLPQRNRGIPLKGRTRIIWFIIGIVCWFAFTAYSQFDAAVSLITAPAIILVMLLGQYRQGTLEGSSINAERWMFRLWWVSTALVALGLSLAYIISFYGLLVLGIPFLGLDIFLAVRDRRRIPEISATPSARQ